ncbi:MAG: hypothetical protein K8J31_12940 [Anaerolineae bacterium]|nr:hypothetical protein [Anaerolineae bacterium]
MIRYHQQICPHCQGSGLVRRGGLFEHTCPLCCGRGTINDFDRPIDDLDEGRAPPLHASVRLLARVVPLGGKTSGWLLHKRHVVRRPQGLPIYGHSPKRGGPRTPFAA